MAELLLGESSQPIEELEAKFKAIEVSQLAERDGVSIDTISADVVNGTLEWHGYIKAKISFGRKPSDNPDWEGAYEPSPMVPSAMWSDDLTVYGELELLKTGKHVNFMFEIGVEYSPSPPQAFAFDLSARFSYDSEDGMDIRAAGTFNLTMPAVEFSLTATFFMPRVVDDEGIDMKVTLSSGDMSIKVTPSCVYLQLP